MGAMGIKPRKPASGPSCSAGCSSVVKALSETTASTGRMACTQDGNSTGASVSSSSGDLMDGMDVGACCDVSATSGSGRDSQSGIYVESRESTSWFEREAESFAGEKRLASMAAGSDVEGVGSSSA